MDKIYRLGWLESRQIELSNTMAQSDGHAAKCAKLGISFAEAYPQELEAYKAANAEFNANEHEIAALQVEIEQEREEQMRNDPVIFDEQ